MAFDGASGLFNQHITPETSDARWLAQKGALEYGKNLEISNLSMRTLCHNTAKKLADEFKTYTQDNISRDAIPSAGLAALRLIGDKLEYYGLGDLTVLLRFKDGHTETIHNQNLTNLDNTALSEMVTLAEKNRESVAEQRSKIQKLLQHNRNLRNRPNGYYIFDTTLEGTALGDSLSWQAKDIRAAAVLTDGIADAVNTYHMASDNSEFFDMLEQESSETVLKTLRKLQREDPLYNKYPRFKMSDDATILIADIDKAFK